MAKVNRYTLVLEGKLEKKHLFSNIRVESVCKDFNNYNSVRTNPYFIGDLDFNYKIRTLFYRKYYKISTPNQLRYFDEEFKKIEDEDSLKELYNINQTGKLFIAYRASRKLRLLNIFYKSDYMLLNEYYLEKKFLKYARDIDFLSKLLNDTFISNYVVTKEQYEILYSMFLTLKNSNERTLFDTRFLVDFYYSFIYPKGNRSYINLRFLANFVREYEKKSFYVSEEPIISDSNQLSGQMMLNGYNVGSLREYYEEMKMGIITEEEVAKKLIR